MVTLWIGDFRTKQLQSVYQAAQQTAEYHYLIEDQAEYSWFINGALPQLQSLTLEKANLVIMLGFIDCVYSCAWATFKINKIAEQYAEAINELIAEQSFLNVYVCAVNPIDGDYPLFTGDSDLLAKKDLTEKIKSFNKTLKSKCKAVYIDSYNYLVNTSFTTQDGIRYMPDTCTALHNYIKASFSLSTAAEFLPRLQAPDPEVDSFLYWTPKKVTGDVIEGASPFPIIQDNSVLPSGTAYAWGRFYEITGEEPKLSTKSAKEWWSYQDGYPRGQEPRVGAIACWTNTEDGYVAIVEQVKDDGSIITSESGWDVTGNTDIWRLQNRTKGTGNWGLADYTFQGFIYCPFTTGVAKEAVIAENRHLTQEEMKVNAQYVYKYLSAKGWTINAVAGLLGNVQVESKISPAVWQNFVSGTGTLQADGTRTVNTALLGSTAIGLGLVQWTPYTKLTEWCANRKIDYIDIDSQLQRIDYEVKQGYQWQSRASKGYSLTFDEFISSTRDAYWLAAAFAFCYERPASSSGSTTQQNALRAERGANGEYWYNYLSSLSIEVDDNTPKISSFRVDKCMTTEATVSFLASNCKTAKYSVLKGSTTIKNQTISLKDSYKVINLKNLEPNTKYTVKVEAQNKDGDVVLRELLFTTESDCPSSAKKIEFSLDKSNSFINSQFTLKITKPDYIGYKVVSSGYDIQLIVNNSVVKTIIESNAAKDVHLSNFTLKDKFNYTARLGDSIQIGVRVWTKDSSGTKVYDAQNAKTSNPIYLCNNSIKVYINK